ncbi:MAG: hypothetical protein K2P78_03065 [Gemmataceae bacterium]|nr:hypothetical protein [Gemmataceae bacterium]
MTTTTLNQLCPRRRVALHEAGHAVAAELFGWRVRGLSAHGLSGLTTFSAGPPHPLADIAVSCIGHAAELYFCGGCRGVSRSDRADTRAAFARAGVRASGAMVREVENRLAGLFWSVPQLVQLVGSVATALLESDAGYLTRRELLSAAGPAVRSRRLRRRVRRLCEMVALDVSGFAARSAGPDPVVRSAVGRAAASVVLAVMLGVTVRTIRLRPGGAVQCSFAAASVPWKAAAVEQAAGAFGAGRSVENRLGVVFNHSGTRSAVREVAAALTRFGVLGPAAVRAAAGDVLDEPAAMERAERITRVAMSGFRG